HRARPLRIPRRLVAPARGAGADRPLSPRQRQPPPASRPSPPARVDLSPAPGPEAPDWPWALRADPSLSTPTGQITCQTRADRSLVNNSDGPRMATAAAVIQSTRARPRARDGGRRIHRLAPRGAAPHEWRARPCARQLLERSARQSALRGAIPAPARGGPRGHS